MATERAAVFIDRDGVLIQTPIVGGIPRAIASVDEIEVLAGVPEALQALRRAGFWLGCATNQPDVARSLVPRSTVEVIHSVLLSRLDIDAIMTCWHDDVHGCVCRKPAPGLLLAMAATNHLDLASSFMVGDRWRDIQAGLAAGCRTVLVDRGLDETVASQPDLRVPSLAAAVPWIVEQGGAARVLR